MAPEPITPSTHPDRFTDEERRLAESGRCPYQTGYGLPAAEYCGEPSKPGTDYGRCGGHATAS